MRYVLFLIPLLGAVVLAQGCGPDAPSPGDGGTHDAGTPDGGPDSGPDAGSDGGPTGAPPVNTLPASVQLLQGTFTAFSNTISVADADAPSGASVRVSLSVSSGALTLATEAGLVFENGTSNGATAITVSGTFDAVNAALDGLTYTPPTGLFGTLTLTLSTASGGLTDVDACALVIAESLPPTSSDRELVTGTKGPLTFDVRALTAHEGVVIDRAIVTSCTGAPGSTLVLEGVTVDCAATPVTIPVVDRTADTALAGGVEHRFAGTWTPGSSNEITLAVELAFEDSQQPPRRSGTYALSLRHRYVNQGPTLQYLGSGEPPGTSLNHTLHYRIEARQGGAHIGYGFADPDAHGEQAVEVLVEVSGGPPTVGLQFAPSEGVIEVLQDGKRFRLVGTQAEVDQVLRSMEFFSYDTESAEFDVVLTASDNGFDGACTVDDPARCAKTATATLHAIGATSAP